MLTEIDSYLKRTTHAAPLAVFRILFGLMMFISVIRFWANGWIEKFYLEPAFHFPYYGFEWVKPLGSATYILFVICGTSALMVSIGIRYRWSIIAFFLSWTYIELMDKTTYLNHYYFISILSFLMIFLPMNAYYSYDAWKNISMRYDYIPKWTKHAVMLLIGMVYFYAGLAKLQKDWLIDAMPLKLWLPSKYSVPFLGDLLHEEWIAYAFSWGGAVYDLTIPFLLLFKRTRTFAFVLVIIFHVLTRVLFPIGMFPYIMIVSALIFFDANVHQWILTLISKLTKIRKSIFDNNRKLIDMNSQWKMARNFVLIAFFAFQILWPHRFLLYPGNLFWTEQGFRYSWRVMLIEKAGYANFKIVDGKTGNRFYVQNDDFLTPQQEKMMSTQPDMILDYAHYLGDHFARDGHQNIEIYVESYVALNGAKSKPYVNPKVDLMKVENDWKNRDWLMPFE